MPESEPPIGVAEPGGSPPPPPPPSFADRIFEKEKQRPEHVIWGTIGALILSQVLAVPVSMVGGSKDKPDDIAPPALFLMILVSAGTMALLAILWCRRAPEGLARRLLLVRPIIRGPSLWLLLPATWAPWIAGTPLMYLGQELFGQGAGGLEAFTQSYASAPWGWKAAFLVASTLGVGIGEELLFRGYLQQGLLKSYRPVIAVLITVALFAAGHLPPARVMFVIPLSFWLGYVALRTGSLFPGILCHTFVNLTGHSLLAMGFAAPYVFLIAFLLGVPAFCLAIRALRRSAFPPAPTPAPAALPPFVPPL